MARPNKNFEPQKERLIKISLDFFAEQGYENTTITEIMRNAGLTKAGMYHYFSSKEELLDAAIDYCLNQELEMLQNDMKHLTVEEKMLLVIRGNVVSSDLVLKMIQIKHNNRNSYAAYRIRERMIHLYIPVIEEILIEGIEKGIYETQYPQASAEFIVLLAKALVEPNILPVFNRDDQMLRTHAYLQLITGWLHISPKHSEDITALFEQIVIERMGEDREKKNGKE